MERAELDFAALVNRHGMGPNMAFDAVKRAVESPNGPEGWQEMANFRACLLALADFAAAGILPDVWRIKPE